MNSKCLVYCYRSEESTEETLRWGKKCMLENGGLKEAPGEIMNEI